MGVADTASEGRAVSDVETRNVATAASVSWAVALSDTDAVKMLPPIKAANGALAKAEVPNMAGFYAAGSSAGSGSLPSASHFRYS